MRKPAFGAIWLQRAPCFSSPTTKPRPASTMSFPGFRSSVSSNPALNAKMTAISATYKHFNDVNQILLKAALQTGPTWIC
jgi:hypothetical protein